MDAVLDDFSSRADASIFTSIALELFGKLPHNRIGQILVQKPPRTVATNQKPYQS